MLMQEATPKMIKEWKTIYEEHKSKLFPNRKNGIQIVEYLKNRYILEEIDNEKWKESIVEEFLLNEFSAEKLPKGKIPNVLLFSIKNEGLGKLLYENQDKVFKGSDIIVAIELETGYFHIEGSSRLYDDLFVFRGLDEKDLKNYFLVAQYVILKK